MTENYEWTIISGIEGERFRTVYIERVSLSKYIRWEVKPSMLYNGDRMRIVGIDCPRCSTMAPIADFYVGSSMQNRAICKECDLGMYRDDFTLCIYDIDIEVASKIDKVQTEAGKLIETETFKSPKYDWESYQALQEEEIEDEKKEPSIKILW